MKGIEFRRANGELDEVVVHDSNLVHFEMMSDTLLWCGIYVDNGKRVIVEISAPSKLTYRAWIDE